MGWFRLLSAGQSLICKWDAISQSQCCRTPSIRYLLKVIYGLEEVVWKIPKRLFSAWPSLVSGWNERSISKSLFGLKHPVKFLLIRTYSLEEGVFWRIERWLFSGWPPSLISEWNDLSNAGSPFCLEYSHQFSAQEKIWVWRCCLKNSKMDV